MLSGSARHSLYTSVLYGIILGLITSLFACKGEESFPISTLVDEIADNTAPSLPFEPFPSDKATNVSRTTILTWNAIDDNNGELNFEVFFCPDLSAFKNIIDIFSTTEKSFKLNQALTQNVEYFWKINVRDEIGNWTFGNVWSFTTGIELTNPPFVTILSPVNNTEFNINDPTVFRTLVTDIEDTTLSGNALVWLSNIDSTVGQDSFFVHTSLSAGVHTITLTATDTHNKKTSESIVIAVDDTTAENIAPSATIEFSNSGSIFGDEDTIMLRRIGRDLEDGALADDQLSWNSSIDNFLGNRSELSTQLTEGTHTVTL